MRYEFICLDCKTIFEVDCSIKEYDNVFEFGVCPECGGTNKKRYFSTNSVPNVKNIETIDGNSKYKSPDWFKDRMKQINKEVGGKSEILK